MLQFLVAVNSAWIPSPTLRDAAPPPPRRVNIQGMGTGVGMGMRTAVAPEMGWRAAMALEMGMALWMAMGMGMTLKLAWGVNVVNPSSMGHDTYIQKYSKMTHPNNVLGRKLTPICLCGCGEGGDPIIHDISIALPPQPPACALITAYLRFSFGLSFFPKFLEIFERKGMFL